MLAEHAFSLGIHRVAAYVNVGNVASERVAERAGFTREGIVRSMPVPDGRRVDKTLSRFYRGNDRCPVEVEPKPHADAAREMSSSPAPGSRL